jgi:hypothetical protein
MYWITTTTTAAAAVLHIKMKPIDRCTDMLVVCTLTTYVREGVFFIAGLPMYDEHLYCKFISLFTDHSAI